jgi:predicted DNA-binding transcriptional regulator AlpA
MPDVTKTVTSTDRAVVLPELEAAQHIGLSVSTLRRMRYAGVGPVYVRLSERRIGYRITALDDYLATRASTAA